MGCKACKASWSSFSSFKICALIRQEFSRLASSCNKATEGHQGGVCVEARKHIQIHCTSGQSSFLEAVINLWSRRPKTIHACWKEGGFISLNLVGGRSAILGTIGVALHLWVYTWALVPPQCLKAMEYPMFVTQLCKHSLCSRMVKVLISISDDDMMMTLSHSMMRIQNHWVNSLRFQLITPSQPSPNTNEFHSLIIIWCMREQSVGYMYWLTRTHKVELFSEVVLLGLSQDFSFCLMNLPTERQALVPAAPWQGCATASVKALKESWSASGSRTVSKCISNQWAVLDCLSGWPKKNP